jgi:hypothetical protein
VMRMIIFMHLLCLSVSKPCSFTEQQAVIDGAQKSFTKDVSKTNPI